MEAATIVSKAPNPPWEGISSGLTGKPKMARKTSSAPDLDDTRLFSWHDALITPTMRISLKISNSSARRDSHLVQPVLHVQATVTSYAVRTRSETLSNALAATPPLLPGIS